MSGVNGLLRAGGSSRRCRFWDVQSQAATLFLVGVETTKQSLRVFAATAFHQHHCLKLCQLTFSNPLVVFANCVTLDAADLRVNYKRGHERLDTGPIL